MNGRDTIVLAGLRGFGRHGIFAFEREGGQEFVVDVALTVDLRAAAASDDLADTVDYGDLAQQLLAVVEGEPVRLLETLAARLADLCLAQPRVERVQVTVHKPEAPVPAVFGDVAVTVVRERG